MELLVIGALVAVFVVVIGHSDRAIAVSLVIAMFVSRPSLDVAGLSLRLEIVVALACLWSLASSAMSRRLIVPLRASTWTSVFLVLFWLLASFIASVANAPAPASSLSVWAWTLGNVVTAVWIARHPSVWTLILRGGALAALVSAGLSIVLWGLATAGLSEFGVQEDPAYGGYAAYAFSIEANILAGLICLWTIVAAYNPGQVINRRVRLTLLFAAPLAILATHTRAALVAFIIGLLIVFATRRTARPAIAGAAAISAVPAGAVLVLSSDSGLTKFFDLFDFEGGNGALRAEVNMYALREWWDSDGLLVGLGFNSFGQRNYDVTRPDIALPGYLGNLPIQIAYDGGLIALAALGGAAAIVMIKFVREGRFAVLLAVAVPYFVFSVATSVLWLLETWLFVGLAWGYSRERWPVPATPPTSETNRTQLAGRR